MEIQSITEEIILGGLYTVTETKKYLRYSRAQLWKIRKRGEIKATLVGGKVLFIGMAITAIVK